MQHYGEFRSESLATENTVCREIIREINQFGINERQRLFLIYLLAMELENNLYMKEITSLIRTLEENLLVSDSAEDTK